MSKREYFFIELNGPMAEDIPVIQQLAAHPRGISPQVTVATMDEKEVQSRIASDRYIGHAPAIPLQLIRPISGVYDTQAISAMSGVEAIGAHTSNYRGQGVKVAILDTGIDLDHDAFCTIKHKITFRDF